MNPRRVVIIGAMGNLGRLFASTLRGVDLSITGIDIADGRDDAAYSVVLRGDIASPTPDLMAALGGADCVIVCLPEHVALQAFSRVTAAMRAGSLWVDTLPVKHEICNRLAAVPHLEAVSLNPMFGPDLGFREQNVAAVLVSNRGRASWLIRLLEGAGARVTVLGAAEHDRLTASVQVATHAALLLFGLALHELNPGGTAALDLSTPPHRLLLSLLGRIASTHPHVYWSIQRDHPDGEQVRAVLSRAATALETMVAGNDERGFTKCLTEIRSYLEPARTDLETLARAAVSLAVRGGNGASTETGEAPD